MPATTSLQVPALQNIGLRANPFKQRCINTHVLNLDRGTGRSPIDARCPWPAKRASTNSNGMLHTGRL